MVDEAAFASEDLQGAVDYLATGGGEEDEDMALEQNQHTVQEWLDYIDSYSNEIPPYPGSFDN